MPSIPKIHPKPSVAKVFGWSVVLTCLVCMPSWGIDQSSLRTLLEKVRAEKEMPGLRAAVKGLDGQIIRAAVGLADTESQTALDDEVGMPGGSTGKTFVAALTLLLVEDGVLSLDDHATKWLGDKAWYKGLPNAKEIKIRHLLAHTSGLKDYPGTLRFRLAMVRRVLRDGSARFEPEELIRFVHARRALFQAGAGYHYTDAGYLVLGRLIEAVTGRTYYDLLKERILIPRQLDQIRVADKSILPNIATGYSGGARNLKKDGRMKFDPSSEWTGGGLITNPRMLVEFYSALASGQVLQPASVELMLDSGWRNPQKTGKYYGFGVFVSEGGDLFEHGGLWPGYRSHVLHDLEFGVTVAVQTNRDGHMNLEKLSREILALAKEG